MVDRKKLGMGILRKDGLSALQARLTSHTALLSAVGICLAFLALRLPCRAEFLVNWDAVNYALGTNLFSLEHHQPHPPGYIGYVALGWLLNHLTGDANMSFTLLSTASGALAPAALFLLAYRFMPWVYALVTALAFGLSPVVWYYSEVALGYSLAMALALFFLWAGYRARADSSSWFLYLATVLLVLLGSVRQSGALFLIPLWLFVAWSFPWSQRLRAGALLVAGNLAWLIPLFLLAGDPLAYFRASASLASLAVAPTSVFSHSSFGLLRNTAFVAAGILVGVNAGLIVIVLGHLFRGRPLSVLTPWDWKFFLLWLIPSLGTYVLIHTGQLGYVLLVLPLGFLWAGLAMNALAERCRELHIIDAIREKGLLFPVKPLVLSLTILLLVVNAAGSLYLPQLAFGLVNTAKENPDSSMVAEYFSSLPPLKYLSEKKSKELTHHMRQFHVDRNDKHWKQIIESIEEFEPDSTAILALPDGSGSFRHLSYYLPDYRIYGVGKGFNQDFGHLFTAHNGSSNYSVQGLENVRDVLVLPKEMDYLIIPDRKIYKTLAEDVGRFFISTESRATICVVPVTGQAMLHFDKQKDSLTRVLGAPDQAHQWASTVLALTRDK
ncbi:MAG: hypothetical protein ACLFQG_05400 [Desulfovermiculus sp.]